MLLDAAHAIMLEDGYAAVTSRKVAARAGLKPQLVHYYFRTMDDLFLALLRRGAERNLERQARALASPQPLWALWRLNSDSTGTALHVEFTALATHRKTIAADIAAYAETFRRQQLDAVGEALAGYGVEAAALSPVVVVTLMNAVAQVLTMEDGLGVHLGHAELRALVEHHLTRLEGPRADADAAAS
jgi:AcrR family transcriptional regulator